MSMTTATGNMFGAPTGGKVPSGYRQGSMPQFNPAQMQLFQQLFTHVGPQSYLNRLASGDQSTFGEIEAPAMKQFNELQGNIASRFSGMGAGARRSSGFQNTTNQAAADFAEQLQSQRQGLQRQALMDLMGISTELLNQRPYEQYITPKKQPFWKELILGLAPGIASGASTIGGIGLAKKFGIF